jgi:hypothetical protein
MLLGAAALPNSSLASVTFGADLSAPPNVGSVCGGCTRANTGLPAGAPPVTSPITGTIVRWRIKTGTASSGTVTLRVVAPAGGAKYTGAGTGDTETTPTTATITTFSTQLPIQMGDYIGVDSPAGNNLNAISGASLTGANMAAFGPALADGGSPASPANLSGYELLINADVAALPTSSVSVPACSNTGQLQGTVTSDPDPAVAPKVIHFAIDGGAEQVVATSDSGNQGSATIPVPEGSHTLEYWGEDTVGGLESTHHTAPVLVDTTPPMVTITSDQGKTTYAKDAVASISVAASDSGSGLQTDPSGPGELLPTEVPGTFTVTRTATDRCGNSITASFTYTVVSHPSTPKITGAKIDSTHGRATFKFKAAGATGFQCALIKPTKQKTHPKPHFVSCRSPRTYQKLAAGKYTFEVRGISSAGPGPVAKLKFKI